MFITVDEGAETEARKKRENKKQNVNVTKNFK